MVFIHRCHIHFTIGVNAYMLWRRLIVSLQSEFDARLEHLDGSIGIHNLYGKQNFDSLRLHMPIEIERFEYVAFYIISKAYAFVVTESIMEIFSLFHTSQQMS